MDRPEKLDVGEAACRSWTARQIRRSGSPNESRRWAVTSTSRFRGSSSTPIGMSRRAADKRASITVLPVTKILRALIPSLTRLSRAETVGAKWIVLR